MARSSGVPAGPFSWVALLSALVWASSGHAQEPRSIEREPAEPPPHGPTRPQAELPPEGPVCPGEESNPSGECAVERADPRGPKSEDKARAFREKEREAATEDSESAPGKDGSKRPPGSNDGETEKGGKRTVPEYDGIPEKRRAKNALLWIPRGLLFPLYLVSEYGIRRPLGFVAQAAIKYGWIQSLVDFFTFGPNRQAGLVPTALYDFGFRSSVGVFGFWNDAATEGHDIRLRAATGGSDWGQFVLANRLEISEGARIELRGAASLRPDHVFYDLGPLSSATEYRYSRERYDVELNANVDFWRTSEVATLVGFRSTGFDIEKGCCNDPTVREGIDRGELQSPPGLFGYDIVRSGVRLRLDTRHRRRPYEFDYTEDFLAPPGSGTQLELTGVTSHSVNLSRAGELSPLWIDYGATWGGYVALPGYQRTVGLELSVEFVDPLTEGDVPFTEQARLGGDRVLRGFLDERLIDRSALAGRLRYSWPIWAVLDGTFEYGVGSVFGEHLSGFDPKLLRQSFGLGIEASSQRDHSFQFLLAVGTEPFSRGSQIDTFRMVIGGDSGI